ncbi:MAG: YceI family protein [Kiritimatiellia bacterium]
MKRIALLILLSLCIGTLFAETRTLLAVATFDGTSTLHDFTGSGTSAPTRATWIPLEEGRGVLSAKGIAFEVKSLSTDHKKRDKNMMKMFDPETHPLITGEIKDLRLGDPKAGKKEGQEADKQDLTIQLNGKTLTVPITITTFQTEGDAISFTCSFSLSLEEAGLQRPSVLGLIRVGDNIALTVYVTLTPQKD